MAEVDREYSGAGDEWIYSWIHSSEVIGRIRAAAACDLVLAIHTLWTEISCGRITRARLHLPDNTIREVPARDLLNDLDQFWTGYNKDHDAIVYLACAEIDLIWPKQQSETPLETSPVEKELPAEPVAQPEPKTPLAHPGDNPAEACTREFLTRLMRLDPENKARQRKADLKDKCQKQCGEIPIRSFERIWPACIDETGASAYKKTGPRGEMTAPRRSK
jgi:hypothetical protein